MIQSNGFYLFGTDWILEQWMRWSRVNHGISACFQSREPFAKFAGKQLPSPVINDDDALIIDRLVSQMRHNHNQMGDVVIYYFAFGSTSAVCRKMKIGRRKAESLLNLGISLIDDGIRTLEKMAA